MAEPFIGQVDLNGFSFAPAKWAECNGATIQISANQALFSLLGNAYGGDGRTTFALPDLRGRVATSMGIRPGTSFEYKTGTVVGAESTTMKDQQLVSHTHLASFKATATAEPDVEISATIEDGENSSPSTGAACATVKAGGAGVDRPEKIYFSGTPTGKVALGGVISTNSGGEHGTVAVGNTGSNQAFSILQPGMVMSYSIALQGLFPSRS